MFTGIIEAVKPIKAIRQVSGKINVSIQRPIDFNDLKIGGSIACNGICLTVIEFNKQSFTVELMHETLLKTNASKWQKDSEINLERALKIDSRFDGHWVQGHVDTITPLLEKKTTNSTLFLTLKLPSADNALVVKQGSIAINGVSLTISALKSNRFTVALIGHTIGHTNLSQLALGDKVNLEYDILGKYVHRNKEQNQLSQEFLHEYGF